MIRYIVIIEEFVAHVCNVVFKIHITVTPGAPVLLRAVLRLVLYKHGQKQCLCLLKFTTK